MSINLFADRKMAMGFAGVIAGLAVIAGLSMGAFAPRGDDDVSHGGDQSPRVAVIDRTAPPPTRQPTATWEGDGPAEEGASDDWAGAHAPALATFEADRSEPGAADHVPDPQFGEYAPDRPSDVRTTPRHNVSRPAGGPVIRSRAAANAPALRAPGESRTPPRLTRVD